MLRAFFGGTLSTAIVIGSCLAPTAAVAVPQALRLSNTSAADYGYVRVPDQPALHLQQFTVEMWIRPQGSGYGLTGDAAGEALFAKPEEGAAGYGPLSYHMGWAPATEKLYFLLVNTPPGQYADFSSIGRAPLDSTTHVAFSFDGTTMRIFINGIFDSGHAYPYPSVYYGSEPVIMGAGNYGFGYLRRYQGLEDDVRLWNYARSDSQIARDMHCVLTGNEPGLQAYWKLDGTPLDATVNHADGAQIGTMTYVSGIMGQCGTTAVPRLEGPRMRLLALAAMPTPSSGSVDVVVQVPTEGFLSLDVFDVRGALVKRLAGAAVASGQRVFRWDGRDSGGRRLGAGTYWAKGTMDGRQATAKILVVR
jgi:hypothetical protein